MTLITWVLLASACLAGAASPGPSVALLSKTVMDGGRRAGVVFGLAHGLGIFFYAFLVAFGLSVTLSFIPFLIDFLNIAGVVFLLWLAYIMFRSSFALSDSDQQKFQITNTLFGNFGSGFLIVFLNPKIALFFLAIFTQFLGDASSFQEKAIMVSTATTIDTSWYIFLTFIIALPKFRKFLQLRARSFEFVLGCFFIILCLLLGHKILVEIFI
jgi:threonine/homoserine/homoserine lactone efflux protein